MDNKAAALGMYEAVNDRRLDQLDEVIAAQAAFHLGHLPTPVGRDEIKSSMVGYVDAFPDLRLTVEDVLVDGDRVAVRLVAEGTHQGVFGAVDATGRPISVTETDFLRMADGKVVEGWVLYDQFTFLTQLGLLPDLATA
jgi:predicted ester cyclase